MRRRLKRLRHDPRYPLALAGLYGIGAWILFVIHWFLG